MTIQPRVVDISHHNTVDNLQETAGAGIWGVIHKATQGTSYRDPDYAKRRPKALAAGLRWAAYHFCDSSDVTAQINNFIAYAKPGAETMLALDFEDHNNDPHSPKNMSIQNLVRALRLMEQRIGTKAALYSGNRLRENIGKLSQADRAYVASHPLWLCQYGPQPKLPPGFTRSFLWQFTDGSVGPQPHHIAGISGSGIDLNAFNGTREELESMWKGPVSTDLSSQSSHGAQAHADDDSPAPAPSRSDDTSDSLPPFMRPTPANTGGLNVRVPTARYDVTVEVVQRELDAMGYHEVGDIDGKWGGKTAAGIKAFFTDRGITDVAEMGPTLNDAITRAKAEGFTRPIAPARANATAKDIAPKVEAVRVTLWQKFAAKIAAGAAGLGLTGSTLSDTFTTVRDKLQPVQDMFNQVPGTVWFLLMLVVAGTVWYATSRAAQATTKDYNTGRLN